MSRWRDPGADLEERVEALLCDLGHRDLVAVLLGDFTPFSSRGVPAPHYVDAGTGLRDAEGATAFPAGIALAASFDPDLAERYGAAVGEQARRAGFTVVLGPTLDLARDPVCGRIGEAFGEDPHLAGVIGAAHVTGLQSRHVVAQVKHYVGYTTEKRRTGHGLDPRGEAVDVTVSDAMLHDTLLRPFEAAVRAGAWSMMGSYNRLRGEYVCQGPLLELPRRLWHWRGFYCPDFLLAVRDPAKALAAGLDLGALGGDGGRDPDLLAGLPESRLRGLVGNVARAMIGCGLVDDPLPPPAPPATPAHREIALETAVAGAVLLANDGVLPLAADSRVALIGPSGEDAFHVVGGAAAVTADPSRVSSPRDALADHFPDLRVAQGSLGDVPLPLVPAEVLRLPQGGPGIEVEFSDGHREVRAVVDHVADPHRPAAPWPSLWRTRITPRTTGAHRFSLTFGGEATLLVAGQVVLAGTRELEVFVAGPATPLQAVVELTAGEAVDLEIRYAPGPAITIPVAGLGPTLRLGWQEPDSLLAEAVAVAATAEVAVVLVGVAAGEGMDRTDLRLPGDQDELVRRVAEANPNTVVVLNASGAVECPWADQVAAILQLWYPGETFGEALAALLLGDAEPGGRLPLTFPRYREQLPGAVAPGEIPERLDLDVPFGYRSRGLRDQGARFPFGFGLGYADTSWEVAAHPGGVMVQVTNHTDRPTTDVVQVYDEEGSLVAFSKVRIEACGVAAALVPIGAGALARWDAGAGRRITPPGPHRLRVARHSDDPGTPVVIAPEG